MGEPSKADDRLPWLDPPRSAGRRPRAARRAQRPLLILLALFLASAVAVMAFLAGRGSGPALPPLAIDEPVAPTPVPTRQPAASVTPPAPTPPPAQIVAVPTPPAAIPEVAQPKPRVRAVETSPKTVRPKAAAPSARWVTARRSIARAARKKVERASARPRPAARRYRWPKPSATAPSGRVVQLGAYYSGRQTMAAWQRLRRADPYLAQLPRRVTVTPARGNRPRYYRLRIGTRSPQHARAVCERLHRIGRGCIVV